MDKLSRRSLLRALAGGALTTAGTVILARTSLAALGTPENTTPADLDVQARAAELDAGGLGPAGEAAGEAHAQFLNFPGGGWGNGGRWRNLPWGNGFRNVAPWHNGGWRNGGWRNGGFRNGGFRNW
jgi:rSAM-associated Gly-rich repeat protein